ncbi:hypothetical protein EBI01_07495 [Marinomonas rhizomae]|uniref:Phage integrase family protein n=1 Tax=Marinomonas rhizomae TaxID=491948 RepID=A0A366J992_9GAMM|nr:tyrosine-type recombinase/integrase [Marinomonas rhizomae]RBP83571.1 phage integrase family protein [Marinomonas rhizomae]RNF74115.1 hypothetical protein EBI01_07495 [Marinomonas rhizomae]
MWFMQHIDADKTYSEAYVSTASSYIGNHLLSQFAQVPLKDIDKPLLYKLLYIRMQEEYALSTIKGVLSVLKTAFTRAKELGLIASNPLEKITLRSFTTTQPEARPGNLKPHDLPVLVAAIHQQAKAKRVFFMTQLLHGTRIGETALAEWRHFFSNALEWCLPPENTKNGKEHRLPITQHAMDLINSLPRKGRYIFSVKGDKPISKRTVERWYQALSDDIGIKFTSHDMRKLARDCWQDKKSRDRLGFLIMERGEMLLNHERDGLDKRYMHKYSREQMRKALGEWELCIDCS